MAQFAKMADKNEQKYKKRVEKAKVALFSFSLSLPPPKKRRKKTTTTTTTKNRGTKGLSFFKKREKLVDV